MDLLGKGIFRLLILICLPFSSKLIAQGQASSPYIPNVIPPSPNAASLMKFSDVPVSPYTGTADITVPIYTIQAKGIQVPVSLSYHTGGVKLKEEASWVGLGWALNAGGMISRTIMQHDDFGSIPYFTTMVPQLPGDMTGYHPSAANNAPFLGNCMYDFYCNYLVNTTAGNEDLYQAFTASTDIYDMEPDIFSYNFPGHSGKFIFTRLGQVILQKQENIKIQVQSGGLSFTIIDDQGNKFYFNVTEKSQTVGAAQPVSSWLLSKIVTEQNDSVIFNYASGGAGTSLAPDVNQTYNAFCSNAGLTSSSPPPTIYYNQTLQTINFSNGQLQFLFDANRSDLSGAYKLDSIILYSKNAVGALTYQKEHDFYYSYFNGGYASGTDTMEFDRLKLDSVKEVSGAFSLPSYSFLYNNINPGNLSAKHSFNADHWGYFNGASNTAFIPSINCGYSPPGTVGQNFSYNGANREPNLEYMQTFSLAQVNYPTGGKTVLAYQANDYDYTLSSNGPTDFQYQTLVNVDSAINIIDHGTTSGTINLTHLFPQLPSGSPQSNVTVSITFRYLTDNNTVYQNSSNKIYFNITGPGINVHQDINGATCQPNSPVCTVSIPITITELGIYNWSGYIDASVDTINTFAQIRPEFQFQETQTDYNLFQNNNYISPAAGLRIQSITNYKDPVNIASERLYSYGYLQDKLGTGTPQQYSYGRLMSFPSYARYSSIPTGTGGYCFSLALFSSSNTALTSVIQGNIVGYDQVTETTVDPLTGLDLGKTVYNYFNSADTSITYGGFRFPGTLNIGNNLNGSLLSKTEYSNYGVGYTKLAETDNFYHTTNRIIYYSPKYVYVYPRSGLAPQYCAADTAVESETTACFYPSMKSERILLDSTINILYQQGDPTKSVVTRNTDYYDNPIHYQVTRSKTVDSKGDTLITHLKYPQDYIPIGDTLTGNTILDSMIRRNMVSETIEKQDSFYYLGSSAGYITGAQLSLFRILSANANTIVPDKSYKLDIQSPITNFQPFSISGNTTSLDSRNRQMISFDQYDNTNNLQQYTTTDLNPVTIIWDYNHIYPIAQVKNAIISDVAATSFEADGTGNWTYTGAATADTTSITGGYCYNLANGNITKSGLVSTNTYILSYWTKNSTSLSITGTVSGYPIKGKTIGSWTYYEYKITGQTSVTLSGTGFFDELRLYPSTALMTTYTYAPLAGMTTSCDLGNKVTYYFYDAYKRLKRIKDQDGNIIKTFQYHYANQYPVSQ